MNYEYYELTSDPSKELMLELEMKICGLNSDSEFYESLMDLLEKRIKE